MLSDLIYPLFVKDGMRVREEVAAMPGVYRLSQDTLLREAEGLLRWGIGTVLVFGIPKRKDRRGSSAYEENNLVSQAVKKLKRRFPDLTVMTDVCLCAYTSDGHCGIIRSGRKKIDSKATLAALSRMALSHAEAGADYVAPSAMAQGQVHAIRKALDANNLKKTKILGYSAKFASNFYGPFREIAASAPAFGDRSAYQLSYADARGAIQEIEDDIAEGADMVMVKPALAYLDIIKEASLRFAKPLVAYNVSGEYAMIKQGAARGFWDERKMVFETITAIKRAGADFIITYHAKEISRWLRGK